MCDVATPNDAQDSTADNRSVTKIAPVYGNWESRRWDVGLVRCRIAHRPVGVTVAIVEVR